MGEIIKKHLNFFAISLFLLLSIVILGPELISGKLIARPDFNFHFQRLYEIATGFKLGKIFPDVSAYTFGSKMYGVNFFYPYVIFYPFAILMYFFGAVKGFLLGEIVCRFAMLTTAYWIGIRFTKSKIKALSLALVYGFSFHILSDQFYRDSLAETVAMIFLPIVVYGFYELLFADERKWLYASIGLTLVIYTHAFTALIILTLLILTLIYLVIFKRKLLTTKRLINWGKTLLTLLALSAITVIPFIEQISADKISFAKKSATGSSILTFFSGLTTINLEQGIGAFGLFATLMLILVTVLLIRKKKFDHQLKVYGFLIIIFGFVSSSLFPWDLFKNTPLGWIKFSWRWFMFATLFASLYLVRAISILSAEKKLKWLKLIPLGFLINGMVTTLAFSVNSFSKNNDILIDQQNYVKVFNSASFGDWDFLTKAQRGISQSSLTTTPSEILLNEIVVVDGKYTKLKLKHQGYLFYVNNISPQAKKVLLPMTYLKGMQAQTAQGKKLTLIRNKSGYPVVSTDRNTKIEIIYRKTFLHKLSIIVSIGAWIMVIIIKTAKILTTKRLKRDQKNIATANH